MNELTKNIVNVRTIVEKHLRRCGFDGLWNDFAECGCELDDLMPCDGEVTRCEPGYKIPCGDDCPLDGNCDWHIGPKREPIPKIYDSQ